MPDYSPYEILGVPPGATQAEVRSAYARAARLAHPDAGGTAGMFGLVQEAYDTLSDPARRAAYDRSHTGGERATGVDSFAAEAEPESEPAQPDGEVPIYDAVVDDRSGGRRTGIRLGTGLVGWRAVAVRITLGGIALALFWGLVQPIWQRDLRPAAATPDLLDGAMFVVEAAVLAYVICLVASIVGFYLPALAALTVLALGGLIAWPIAYWGIATAGERWSYVGWVGMWVSFQAVIVVLLEDRWLLGKEPDR